MTETNHLLLRTACTRAIHKLTECRDNEWHSGDEYDRIVWQIERLERFREYVKLDEQFRP